MKARGRPPGGPSGLPVAIAKAAELRLREVPIREIKVRDLALDANTSAAMINYYFGGKQELFCSILEDALVSLERRLRQMAKRETCPEKVVGNILCLIDEHINATLSHSSLFDPHEKDIKDAYRERCASRIYNEVVRTLEPLYAATEDPSARARAAANVIISTSAMPFFLGDLYESTLHASATGPDREEFRAYLTSMLVRSFGPGDAGAKLAETPTDAKAEARPVDPN